MKKTKLIQTDSNFYVDVDRIIAPKGSYENSVERQLKWNNSIY